MVIQQLCDELTINCHNGQAQAVVMHVSGEELKNVTGIEMIGDNIALIKSENINPELKDKLLDLKANFDYFIEGQNLKIKELGERCNQLLKDKGDLTDRIDDIKANCDLAIEGKDVKIMELEQELTVEKDLLQEETNLHLHAEEYIKSLEEEHNKLLDVINNQDIKIADLESKNAELKEANQTLATMNNDMWVELEKKRAESQGITNRLHQLTKAKEIISEFMKYEINEYDGSLEIHFEELKKQAEQFLKEIEK